MVSSGICEIAWWFAALLPSTWPCITENAASALILCLEDNCGEGYHHHVRARRSATLPYSCGIHAHSHINAVAGKYMSVI